MMQRNNKMLKAILDCDICRGYLAHIMIQPLRCPGLGYDESTGRKYVGKKGTNSFRWWDEILRESDERQEKERLSFLRDNKEHILTHGLIGIKEKL